MLSSLNKLLNVEGEHLDKHQNNHPGFPQWTAFFNIELSPEP